MIYKIYTRACLVSSNYLDQYTLHQISPFSIIDHPIRIRNSYQILSNKKNQKKRKRSQRRKKKTKIEIAGRGITRREQIEEEWSERNVEEKKREKRTKEGNGRRERRTWKAEKEAEEGKRRMGVNGARRWKFRARVKCRQAQPAGCSRCNDLENSASGVNVSKPASCGRAHVPSSGAHARARAIS